MSGINYSTYCDYIGTIDWEQLLRGCLELYIEDKNLCYTADSYTSQLRSAFTNIEDEVDYLNIKELKPVIPHYYDSCTYSVRNIQVVQLRSGKIALGLDVLFKPTGSSNSQYRCCFRGWWDGTDWHINHLE